MQYTSPGFRLDLSLQARHVPTHEPLVAVIDHRPRSLRLRNDELDNLPPLGASANRAQRQNSQRRREISDDEAVLGLSPNPRAIACEIREQGSSF